VDIALRIRKAGTNWNPVADAGQEQSVVDGDDSGSEDVTLDGSASSDPDGTLSGYIWSEGGNQIATGVNPTVTLPVGAHAITLAVTDNRGSTDTHTVVVTVNPAGTPTFTVLSPNGGESYTIGQTITVTWTSTNYSGSVRIDSNHGGTRWDSWVESTENDGSWTSFALPDGIAKYPSTGWKFRVGAADKRGPSDESDGTFSITAPGANIPPVASATATPTSGDAPLAVNFDGSGSNDPDVTIVSYHWDFGNGAESNEVNPVYTYEDSAEYTATLTVTDNDGATDPATITITVNGNVKHATLTPVADSWIQDEGGNSRDDNMGALDIMAVGGKWQDTYFRNLIKFDLSSLPDDATIVNATLELYHTMNAVEGKNTNNISL
jgi:chitodextrinase